MAYQQQKTAVRICSVSQIVYLSPYHMQFKVPLILCLLSAQKTTVRPVRTAVSGLRARACVFVCVCKYTQDPAVYKLHMTGNAAARCCVRKRARARIFAIGHGRPFLVLSPSLVPIINHEICLSIHAVAVPLAVRLRSQMRMA